MTNKPQRVLKQYFLKFAKYTYDSDKILPNREEDTVHVVEYEEYQILKERILILKEALNKYRGYLSNTKDAPKYAEEVDANEWPHPNMAHLEDLVKAQNNSFEFYKSEINKLKRVNLLLNKTIMSSHDSVMQALASQGVEAQCIKCGSNWMMFK